VSSSLAQPVYQEFASLRPATACGRTRLVIIIFIIIISTAANGDDKLLISYDVMLSYVT